MKKIAAVLIGSIFLFVIACNNKPGKTINTTTFKSKNTDSFNLVFDSVLTEYDKLRTAFINWDTASANHAASALQRLLIYVPYEQLKDDEVATKATSIAQNAADATENLLSQDSIADKRRIFYTVSESIYNLAKTVDYDKGIIYHKKCPMAFSGDQEGWWFSETKRIDNPYFGNKHPKYKNAMLECGTVEDSIDNMH
jgi:hypothetical protein